MLEIIIVFAIYVGLQKLLDKPIEKKIEAAKNTEEAIKQRKRLKRVRAVFFVVFLAAYIIFSFWINFGVGEQDTNAVMQSVKGLTMGAVMLFQYLRQQKKYKEFMGNVSTFGKKEYLEQNDHFAIFLRGFDEDDYAKEADLSKGNSTEKFSEYKFMGLLQQRIPVCAIGMTKEADSPYGATRVYVDDVSWKEDVRELMEKAEEIYILVNDRTSCIWEIEQSAEMLQKTVFLIEEREKYENVRAQIKDTLALPEIPEDLAASPHIILRYHQDSTQFEPFENSTESYAHILQMPVPEDLSKIKRQRAKKGCLWFLGIIFALFIIVLTIRFCNSRNYSTDDLDYIDEVPMDTIETVESEDPINTSPYDEVRAVVSQVELPMEIGNGLTMESIDVLEDAERISYHVAVDEEVIDMDLLKQLAKTNILHAVETEDLQSPELQFWLYCVNHGIGLEYNYQSRSAKGKKFVVTLTTEDLRNAFQRRNAIE